MARVAHTVRITSLCASSGEGIGATLCFPPTPVRVPWTHPGETVSALMPHRPPRSSPVPTTFGERLEDPEATPLCRHFSHCGGCAFQHLSPATQHTWKQAKVSAAFATAGVPLEASTLRPFLVSPAAYAYRNRVDFSVAEEQWLPRDPPAFPTVSPPPVTAAPRVVGFHPVKVTRKWHGKVLPVSQCELIAPAMNSVLPAVRTAVDAHPRLAAKVVNVVVRRGDADDAVLVNLQMKEWDPASLQPFVHALVEAHPDPTTLHSIVATTHNTSVPKRVRKQLRADSPVDADYHAAVSAYLRGQAATLHGADSLAVTLSGVAFKITGNAFFQTNTAATEVLHGVVAAACHDVGDLSSRRLLDFFSGSGLMSLPLARHFQEVHGCDLDVVGVDAAGEAARLNNITNAGFHVVDLQDLESLQASPMAGIQASDVVLVNPNRPGLHPKFRSVLHGAHSVVYVSCNPTSQARDVAELVAETPLRVVSSQAVDLFPHTRHVENVVVLRR